MGRPFCCVVPRMHRIGICQGLITRTRTRTVDKRSFVKVITSGVKAVSAGLDHSMVVKQDGSMWATGNNLSGKLGDGSRRDKHRFVKVIASGVKAVAAGDHHSMVLKQDGSLWATGSNEYGQLGDGSRRDKIIFVEVIPTTMPGSSTTEAVVELAAGGYHSMLVKQDGSLWTAGRNDFGQLGDGSRTEKNSFILVTTSSTTTSSSTVSLVTPKGCKKWCARNEKEWTQKCTWSATCAGCSECLVSTTKAATTASIRCKKWCAAHKQFWKTKCTWSASCAGCFECLGSRAQAEWVNLLAANQTYNRMDVTRRTDSVDPKPLVTRAVRMIVIMIWLIIIVFKR